MLFYLFIYLFIYFFENQSGKRMLYKQQNALWRGQDYKNAENCVSKEPSLDGEATECRLCEHCGCMLNTDYI